MDVNFGCLVLYGQSWHGAACESSQFVCYIVLYAIYNIWFHPLRKYPGPWWLAASRIPYTISVLRGTAIREVKELHEKYGHVVRINPDTLSFTSSQAWPDIYGPKRPGGRGNIPRDPTYYMKPGKAIFDKESHRRLVTCKLAPSLHEVHLQKYATLFISKLQESRHESSTGVVDLARWINLLTTDIAGAFVLGESFGGLQGGQIHPWLGTIAWNVRIFTFIRELSRYPGVLRAIDSCWPRSKEREEESFMARSIAKRIVKGTDRHDLLCIVEASGEERVPSDEMEAMAMLFVIAGSETTASLLTGSVHLLLKHPLVLQKLTSILRKQFRSSSDMTLFALQGLEYLNAVLQESLRLYPPAPGNLFRRTAAEGHVVMGKAIPSHTSLTMHLWAANRSPLNFHMPDHMVPERWMKPRPAEFENDDRDVMKPFGVRPQDCPGKSFAWAEMRLILARMLWHFDFKLVSESCDWIDRQKVFIFCQRRPLRVKITAVA
ncbi:isotrichodermin C-15 hydroxylase [Thelonectria olida]|uniref:Isotrichodermin C-15 hydroxylase n=1 Tax=Thelonectria olida TaxID=1576542 RepID=A0A9P8VWA7_9HYPO|nr:isotrichodermin C-15 hydroxylase [Thelonectria olida]